MFSTPETSVHVRDENREISPEERERERGRLRGKGSGEKVSFKTRMKDPWDTPTTDLGAESEPGNGVMQLLVYLDIWSDFVIYVI